MHYNFGSSTSQLFSVDIYTDGSLSVDMHYNFSSSTSKLFPVDIYTLMVLYQLIYTIASVHQHHSSWFYIESGTEFHEWGIVIVSISATGPFICTFRTFKGFINMKNLPTSIQIGSSVVPFVKSVRNLGVILDRRLSMKEHINKMCQMAYWELRRISSIRQYLTEDAAKTLVVSLFLSRLDYGNCLLAGVPECLLHKLQNASSRQEHTKPPLKALHWLPISDRITYKLSCMCYKSVTASTPQYLADLLQIYTPSRTLRFTTDTRKLKIPLSKRNTQARDLSPIRVP